MLVVLGSWRTFSVHRVISGSAYMYRARLACPFLTQLDAKMLVVLGGRRTYTVQGVIDGSAYMYMGRLACPFLTQLAAEMLPILYMWLFLVRLT